MNLHTKKKQFRYRKAQWRRRTIALLAKMRAALDDVDKSQNLPQNFYDMAAALERKGKQGEQHLREVDSLDFFPFVRHDIGMMLTIIVAFSQHFASTAGDPSLVTFHSKNDAIWDDTYYADWSIHTRRQFTALQRYLLGGER